MKTSEKVDVILPKLAKALNELGSVKKGADNPFFKSKYADLNTHIDVAEKALNSQGLMLLQPVNRDERGSFVESIIIDPSSGQYVSSVMDLLLTKQDMQNMGSAVTYARRYTLSALLSMQAEDDDGNSATFGKTTQTSVVANQPTTRSSFRSGKAKAVVNGVTTDTVSATNTETTEEWS